MQSAPPNRSPTILQLTISSAGLIISVLTAAFLALIGLVGVLGGRQPNDVNTPLLTMAWVAALFAALAVPSIIYSVLRLMHKPTPKLPITGSYWAAWVFLLLWPLILAIGNLISKNGILTWLLLPPLDLLAIGIPIWWIVEIVHHRLPSGSPQRGWGLVSTSLFITVPLAMILEILAFGLMLLIFVLAVSSRPEWLAEIQNLSQQIQGAQNDPQRLLEVMDPLLQNPIVVYALFAALSGLAPLIEELVKPLAIWFLVNRRLTEAEGFVAGAICGGSFALFESLLNLSGPAGNNWLTLVAGRAGTATLHIATSALMGWALVSAWRYSAYLKLGLVYLLSVSLHGLWNGLNVVNVVSALLSPAPAALAWINRAAVFVPGAMVLLIALFLILLWGGNRLLRKGVPRSTPGDSTSPAASPQP